jgi:hypothetical protein
MGLGRCVHGNAVLYSQAGAYRKNISGVPRRRRLGKKTKKIQRVIVRQLTTRNINEISFKVFSGQFAGRLRRRIPPEF